VGAVVNKGVQKKKSEKESAAHFGVPGHIAAGKKKKKRIGWGGWGETGRNNRLTYERKSGKKKMGTGGKGLPENNNKLYGKRGDGEGRKLGARTNEAQRKTAPRNRNLKTNTGGEREKSKKPHHATAGACPRKPPHVWRKMQPEREIAPPKGSRG